MSAEGHRGDDVGLAVSGNGTTQGEVLLFQMVASVSVILRNTALPWVFVGCRFASNNGFWLKFVLDFLMLVMPIVLAMTLCASHLGVMVLLETVAFVSLLVFSLCEYCFISREKPPIRRIVNQVIDDQHSPTMFITYLRSISLIATSVAILGVDFPAFPRRFAKTETYGRSVMDVGTATFVFCAAIVDAFRSYPNRIVRDKPRRRFRMFFSSSAILFYLGVGRTALLSLLNYPLHVSEYGLHWNFFITLACLRLITKLLGRRFHLLLGVTIACVYQFLLGENDLQKWLLSEDAPRVGLIAANREGIFSLFGYLSLYYFASVIAKYIYKTGIRLKSWLYRGVQLLVICLFLFGCQKIAEAFFGPPSRRIVNVPYIIEMLLFHTLLTTSLLFVQLLSLFGWAAQMPQFSTDESPFERLKPCLLGSINAHGMAFFLLSNVLTGVVNICLWPSSWTDDLQSVGIISLYMLATCALIHYCHRKQSNS